MARANNGGWDFVKADQSYAYKEDGFIAHVKVLEDKSDDNMYCFRLLIEKSNGVYKPKDGIFEIFHSKNVGGYFSGMSQFYELDELVSVSMLGIIR